jgi:hypothetical protein
MILFMNNPEPFRFKKKTPKLIVCLWVTIFVQLSGAIAMAEKKIDFANQLPTKIEQWKKASEVLTFGPADLFQYINGGAELYRSYNFITLTAITYTNPNMQEIKVDIFDMGRSKNAYGVFSHGRESNSHQVGQGSEYAEGLLNFWKGHYYVSILAYPVNEEKHRVLFSLAKIIDSSIHQEGQIPTIVSKLPKENLISESIRYFRHYVWLNTHFFISNDNILNIDQKTEAVLAKYTTKTETYFVLLIEYPTEKKALAGYQGFVSAYLPEDKEGIKKLDDGFWTGIRRLDKLLVVVLHAPRANLIGSMLDKINRASAPQEES